MTIFTDAKDNTTVLELKKIIEGEFIYFKYIILFAVCFEERERKRETDNCKSNKSLQ